jgi:hypothetical protein
VKDEEIKDEKLKDIKAHLDNEKKRLQLEMLEMGRKYDKYILALAIGAFGLSLIFIQNIAPNPVVETRIFLILAWSFLGLTILCTLLSFMFHQLACIKSIEKTDNVLLKLDKLGGTYNNPYGTMVNICNWLSLLTFMLGMGMLATFAIMNLSFS